MGLCYPNPVRRQPCPLVGRGRAHTATQQVLLRGRVAICSQEVGERDAPPPRAAVCHVFPVWQRNPAWLATNRRFVVRRDLRIRRGDRVAPLGNHIVPPSALGVTV